MKHEVFYSGSLTFVYKKNEKTSHRLTFRPSPEPGKSARGGGDRGGQVQVRPAQDVQEAGQSARLF